MEPFVLIALGVITIVGQLHNYGIDIEKNPHLRDIRVRRQIDTEPHVFQDKDAKNDDAQDSIPEESFSMKSILQGDTSISKKKYAYPINEDSLLVNNQIVGYNNGYNEGHNGYVNSVIDGAGESDSTFIKKEMPGFDRDFLNGVLNEGGLKKFPFSDRKKITVNVADNNKRNIGFGAPNHRNADINNVYGTRNYGYSIQPEAATTPSIQIREHHNLNRKKRSYNNNAYKQMKYQLATAKNQINYVNNDYGTQNKKPYNGYKYNGYTTENNGYGAVNTATESYNNGYTQSYYTYTTGYNPVNNGYNGTHTSYKGTTTTKPKINSAQIIINFGCPKFMKYISIMGRKLCVPADSTEMDSDEYM